MADRFTAAGLDVLPPQAAFYLYPSFGPRRTALAARDGLTTDASLASHLLDRYGMGVLPASVFGDNAGALRIRVATGLLYGDTDAQRECSLASPDPVALSWIAAALDRMEEILGDLSPGHRAGRSHRPSCSTLPGASAA